MTDTSVWDKEIPVPLHLIQYIDEGVRECKAPDHPVILLYWSTTRFWMRPLGNTHIIAP